MGLARKGGECNYIILQLHPCAGGAYGSSPLFTGPHTDGIYMNNSQTLVYVSSYFDSDSPGGPSSFYKTVLG